jgi:hypothetical protein
MIFSNVTIYYLKLVIFFICFRFSKLILYFIFSRVDFLYLCSLISIFSIESILFFKKYMCITVLILSYFIHQNRYIMKKKLHKNYLWFSNYSPSFLLILEKAAFYRSLFLSWTSFLHTNLSDQTFCEFLLPAFQIRH